MGWAFGSKRFAVGERNTWSDQKEGVGTTPRFVRSHWTLNGPPAGACNGEWTLLTARSNSPWPPRTVIGRAL
jgi:hypothetical protein